MKPSTLHKFYLDAKQWIWTVKITPSKIDYHGGDTQGFSLKSVTGDVGFPAGTTFNLPFYTEEIDPAYSTKDDLVTDISGKISFLVYFPVDIAGWFAQDFNVNAVVWPDNIQRLYTTTELISAAQRQSTYGSAGYTSLTLQDASGTSVAARVFANRTPNKTIGTIHVERYNGDK